MPSSFLSCLPINWASLSHFWSAESTLALQARFLFFQVLLPSAQSTINHLSSQECTLSKKINGPVMCDKLLKSVSRRCIRFCCYDRLRACQDQHWNQASNHSCPNRWSLKIGGTEILSQHCTEGWDCDLGFGVWNFLGGNNGLGGFLGPNWKVFHHWTLREHFQGAVIAFGSQPDSEIRVERGWKINNFFCPKNIQYVPRVDEKLTSVKNWVHTCPKTKKSGF